MNIADMDTRIETLRESDEGGFHVTHTVRLVNPYRRTEEREYIYREGDYTPVRIKYAPGRITNSSTEHQDRDFREFWDTEASRAALCSG